MPGTARRCVEVVAGSARHIISTTVTTFGGFLPLILGGGGFWPPFAMSVAGGVGAVGHARLRLHAADVRADAVPSQARRQAQTPPPPRRTAAASLRARDPRRHRKGQPMTTQNDSSPEAPFGPAALITGASDGIAAPFAVELARAGGGPDPRGPAG